jgi:DNA-binding transcriptional LysR family regulator
MKITIRQLEVFDAVAAHGGVANASRHLGMSQSAVSSGLKDLQIILKRPLFIHGDGRRLVITDDGKKLRARVRSLLTEAREIEAGDDTPLDGTLHVGASASIAETVLPRISIQFLKKYPGVQLHIQSATAGELFQSLTQFQMETALIEYFPDVEGLELVPWRTDELWLVVAPDHELGGRQHLKLRDLTGLAWCAREAHSSITSRLRVLVHERVGQMYSPFVATSNEAVKLAAIEGGGIACLPHAIVEDDIARGRLKRLMVDDFAFTRQLSLARPKSMLRSRPARAFDAFVLSDEAD